MDVYEALAHPHRRAIVALLAGGERTAGELAAHFQVSRPAISRQLRILRESGLLQVRKDAQRRVYALRPEGLAEVEDWAGRYRRLWSQRLDALDVQIRRAQRETPIGDMRDRGPGEAMA